MDKNINNMKEEGYQVPEGYLAKSKLHLQSLHKIAEVGEEGYTLPSDYFVKSKKEILAKSPSSTKTRVIQLSKYVGAIAAILIGVYLFPKLMVVDSEPVDLFADLSEEEVQSYLEDTALDLDLIDSEWIEDVDLDDLFTDEDSYEDYLDENVEDLDLYDMESFL